MNIRRNKTFVGEIIGQMGENGILQTTMDTLTDLAKDFDWSSIYCKQVKKTKKIKVYVIKKPETLKANAKVKDTGQCRDATQPR